MTNAPPHFWIAYPAACTNPRICDHIRAKPRHHARLSYASFHALVHNHSSFVDVEIGLESCAVRYRCDLFRTKSELPSNSRSGGAHPAPRCALSPPCDDQSLLPLDQISSVGVLPPGCFPVCGGRLGRTEIKYGTCFPGANAVFSIMSPQFTAMHKRPVGTRCIARGRNTTIWAKTNNRRRTEQIKSLRNAQGR